MANIKWIFKLEFQAYYCKSIDNIRILFAWQKCLEDFAFGSLSSLQQLPLSIHGYYKTNIHNLSNTFVSQFCDLFL